VSASDLGPPVTVEGPSLQRTAVHSDHTRATIRAALYAAAIAVLLCTIPVKAVALLALPLAGFLSVLFYRRWSRAGELARGFAFKLGALTGVFSFVGILVMGAVATLSPGGQENLRRQALELIQTQQARAIDPQTRELFEYFKTQQGMAVMLVCSLLFLAVTFVLLSGAGAAISASLLRRKNPPMQ